MLAGGIVCIIFALPLLLFALFGVGGTLSSDPGSAIVLGMVFGFPGIILMVFGISMIRKSQAKTRLEYEQMMTAQQQWNQNNLNGQFQHSSSQSSMHVNISSSTNGVQRVNESYTIHNPLDPRTAAYVNHRARQQAASSTSSNPMNQASTGNQPKTVDCPGCGAPQTLAPGQSRECEYCSTVVAYK